MGVGIGVTDILPLASALGLLGNELLLFALCVFALFSLVEFFVLMGKVASGIIRNRRKKQEIAKRKVHSMKNVVPKENTSERVVYKDDTTTTTNKPPSTDQLTEMYATKVGMVRYMEKVITDSKGTSQNVLLSIENCLQQIQELDVQDIWKIGIEKVASDSNGNMLASTSQVMKIGYSTLLRQQIENAKVQRNGPSENALRAIRNAFLIMPSTQLAELGEK